MVRHFLLIVGVPAAARTLLGRLVSGDESDAPQITTAADWHVGFEPGPGTIPPSPAPQARLLPEPGHDLARIARVGDHRLVPGLSFKSFGAFVAGAAVRAALVGDTGASGPQNWIGAFGTGRDHVLVTLHAISPEAMTTYSDRLAALCRRRCLSGDLASNGMALTEMQDGKPVFTSKVHFGYTDGISMTTIRGGPNAIRRTTSSHANPGCSSCGTRRRITSCRSLANSVCTAALRSSR